MEKNLLKKYDDIFLNSERLTPFIDENILEGKILVEKALAALISAYAESRVKISSTCSALSIELTIDLKKIELPERQDSIFYSQILKICNYFNIAPSIVSPLDRKIKMSLY